MKILLNEHICNNGGICKYSTKASLLEHKLYRKFEDLLLSKGFTYLNIPSMLKIETLKRQDIGVYSYGVDPFTLLSGSAEQGILERFANSEVERSFYFAKNQCFRVEPFYDGLKYCREFTKLEQYCFTDIDNYKTDFDILLYNAYDFVKSLDLDVRIVDVTQKDAGYHVFKKDIEVFTETYGWLETHSCTYFGDEQSKRFNISGAKHTISNTGIATPRLLIPLLEKGILTLD